jgi:large subunit ribosomal protein L18e
LPTAEKSNKVLVRLIADLKRKAHENKAPIWKDIANRLSKPDRSWAEVNIRSLAQHTKKNDVVVVPGKLLGVGSLDFPLTVAAFSFSGSAADKIKNAGGKSLSISELVDKHPSGKGVRIIC